MISRSPGPPNTTSVVTTKLGSRTEWIRVPAISAPRASTGPCRSASPTVRPGVRTWASVSASSAAVPLGTSGLSSLA
jgi:hypothetical protein